MELKHKKVWLTGASSGIGEALALALAEEGAEIVLTARSKERLLKLKERLSGNTPAISIAPGDVSDVLRMKEIAEKHGPFDVLLANAGNYIPSDTGGKFNSQEYLSLLSVNFGGLLYCMEGALPGMKKSGGGMICGVSSVVGYRGVPRAAAYGASKAAITYFLESARFDLEPLGIKVCVISPGFVKTPLTDKNTFTMPFRVSPEYAARKIIRGIKKEKLEIHFPWQFSWLSKFFRIIPFPLYHLIIKRSSLVRK